MSAGGTFAQLLRAGQWRGYAVKFYPDPGEAGRRAMTDILIEGSEAEPSLLSSSSRPPPWPPNR